MRVQPEEYEQLRGWLAYILVATAPNYTPGSDDDPIVILDQEAVRAPARARQGLSTAIGDMVEMTNDWPRDRMADLDRRLRDAGLPTLSDIRARFGKALDRICRRGAIRNEDEFYLVRNAADLPGEHQATLWNLIEAYENAAKD